MMTRVIAIPEFDKRLKALKKKYPSIRRDIEPMLTQLADGKTPGDRLQGIAHIAYKVRLPNRDAQRGKSGGYRVIYYVYTAESIYMIQIYFKSDMEDISDAEVISEIEDALKSINDDEDEAASSEE